MKSHYHDPTPLTMPQKNINATKKEKKSKHWRSAGWTPLVYPASSLIDHGKTESVVHVNNSSEINPFFPLHKDVLQATTRELLILDGAIESSSLTLSSKTARFRTKTLDAPMSENVVAVVIGPRYIKHVNLDVFDQLIEDDVVPEHTKSTRKRKATSTTPRLPKKKRNGNVRTPQSSPIPLDQEIAFQQTTKKFEHIESAEALVQILLRRALQLEHEGQSISAMDSVDIKNPSRCHDNRAGRPRQVSDADSVESAEPVHEAVINDNEISQFVDFTENTFQFRRDEIPLMMHVSIYTEQHLRNVALKMVLKLTKSLSKETLRLFLGYRASSVNRDKVLSVLSDFLYDVSHAMFAWSQTEQELLASSNMHAACDGKLDIIVKNSLFDNRALKKIGGFDASSLLRHALSIARSTARMETWETFARSKLGRKLLAHHAEGKAYLAGQKRRAHRVKHRFLPSAVDVSEDGGIRSRSSSVASIDDLECVFEKKRRSSDDIVLPDAKWTNLSNVLQLSLKKEMHGKTWGVLLAREGDMCIVDRAPETGVNDADMPTIRRGDMILSVMNERGESASPPSSLRQNARKPCPDWFREIVTLFKTSSELYLVVRRV